MRTRLTELLDIDVPVMLAGMGGVSYHSLVAAVSEAGGIGTLGASTMDMATLRSEIEAVKKLTSKPFGVDLLTASPQHVEDGVREIIAAYGAAAQRWPGDERHAALALIAANPPG